MHKTQLLTTNLLLIILTLYATNASTEPLPANVELRRLELNEYKNLTKRDFSAVIAATATDVASMRSAINEVDKLRERVALQERDLRKLNCIDDQKETMTLLVNLVGDAQKTIADDNNEINRTHFLTMLAVTSVRIPILKSKAELCQGREITYTGRREIRTIIQGDIIPFETVEDANPTAIPALQDPIDFDFPTNPNKPFIFNRFNF